MKTDILRKNKHCSAALLAALTMTVAGHAGAQNLAAPVSGLQILDLSGTPIAASGTVQNYSTSFVASSTASTVTFVFRHDPGFFTLENVVASTGGGPNLLLNGNFQVGAPTSPGGGVPDWTYFVQAGNAASLSGFLGFENGIGFRDGSTQAYDGIDQTFTTVIGQTYTITFGLEQDGNNIGTYQQTSNNGDTTGTGGNGIDAVVYAGNGLPPSDTPDAASTLGLMGAALTGLAALKRKLS